MVSWPTVSGSQEQGVTSMPPIVQPCFRDYLSSDLKRGCCLCVVRTELDTYPDKNHD